MPQLGRERPAPRRPAHRATYLQVSASARSKIGRGSTPRSSGRRPDPPRLEAAALALSLCIGCVEALPEETCLTLACDPNATCENGLLSPRCRCNPGFEGSGLDCEDVDECALGTHECGPGATCQNTSGSYRCACDPGLTGDGIACLDVDECLQDVSPCDPNATCGNLPGSYACTCNFGFAGNGSVCSDIDECATGVAGCDVNATCTNSIGGFTCACNPGYAGSGQACFDVDECADGLANCSVHATCSNVAGAFTCACNAGFTGDGVTCTDVDECANGTALCDTNAECQNTPGSFSCSCPLGYTGDGSTCTPDFDIRLVFAEAPTTAQLQAFELAEARWESLIVQDLPDVTAIPAGCSPPAGVTSVDDLVIEVELQAIDGAGGVLGQAGPRCVRSVSDGAFLPFIGVMRFDTADLSTLASRGQLEAVVLHEMGHVLGIGSAWRQLSLLANPSCSGSACVTGRDTRYVGALGVAAWQSLGGTGDVPVENQRGPGSSDSHWREAGALGAELMSPSLSSINALSVLTLESLADLGYGVAPSSRADPFTLSPLPSFLASFLAGPAPQPVDLGADALPEPVLELDPTGALRPLP